MKTSLLTLISVLALLYLCISLEGCLRARANEISSPDGNLKVEVGLNEGKLFYLINKEGQSVIDTSYLTINLSQCLLGNDSKILKTDIISNDSVWSPLEGEEDVIRNNYNEMKVELMENTPVPIYYNLIFRAYSDGIGLKYIIPQQDNFDDLKVTDENFQINMREEAVVWPFYSSSSQKIKGKATLLSKIDTVPVPLTVKVTDNLFLNIGETSDPKFDPLYLTVEKNSYKLHSHHLDGRISLENETSCVESPWRCIVITSNLPDMMLSRIINNLEKDNFNVTSNKGQAVLNQHVYYDYLFSPPESSMLNKNTPFCKVHNLALRVIKFDDKDFSKNLFEQEDNCVAKEFLSLCPAKWSKTIIPEAKIGEYLTVLRKEKNGDKWFLGTISNVNSHDVKLHLDFLDPDCQYTAKIYRNNYPVNGISIDPSCSISTKTINVNSYQNLLLHLSDFDANAVIFTKE